MKLSVIIPVYNEVDSIEGVIDMVAAVSLPNGWTSEIIVVDDHSTDGTTERLDRLLLDSTINEVIKKPVNEGKGAAVRQGLTKVTGDWVIIQDADLEYDPNEFIRLLAPIVENQAEIVCGYREYVHSDIQGIWYVYYCGRMFMTSIFNLVFSTRFKDIHTCYKLFPAQLVDPLSKFSSNGFAFDAVDLTYTLYKSGYRIAEIPINYQGRKHAEGKKLRYWHGIACILEMIRLRFFGNP